MVEGKQTLHNLLKFLEETLTLIETEFKDDGFNSSVCSREFRKLSAKIKLLIRGVHRVDELLDECLKNHNNLTLAKMLLQSTIADQNEQKVIQCRLRTHAKNKRKSESEMFLQAVKMTPPSDF